MDQKQIDEFFLGIIDQVISLEKLPAELKSSMLEYMAFRRELTKESDRGCALLAAANLDSMLEDLLRRKLIGSKAHKDSLFGYTGPVGSFSSRILLSYSIGLISEDCLHDIQIIRKIRNDFGHMPTIISFEDDKMKSLCQSLRLNAYAKSVRARQKFVNSVSGISGQLEAAIISCDPFEAAPNLNMEQRKQYFDKVFGELKKTLDKSLE